MFSRLSQGPSERVFQPVTQRNLLAEGFSSSLSGARDSASLAALRCFRKPARPTAISTSLRCPYKTKAPLVARLLQLAGESLKPVAKMASRPCELLRGSSRRRTLKWNRPCFRLTYEVLEAASYRIFFTGGVSLDGLILDDQVVTPIWMFVHSRPVLRSRSEAVGIPNCRRSVRTTS